MTIIETDTGGPQAITNAAGGTELASFTVPRDGLYGCAARFTGMVSDALSGSIRIMHYASNGSTVIARCGSVTMVKGDASAGAVTVAGATTPIAGNANAFAKAGEILKLVVVSGSAADNAVSWTVHWLEVTRGCGLLP